MNIFEDLKSILGEENVFVNEPMNKHTTFRIGGKADFLVCPKNIENVKDIISYLSDNSINYYVIGNGSNLLVKDNGFRGVIVKLFKDFSKVDVDGCLIKAEAGATLSAVAKKAMQSSLAGMECLSGIPGTIGGAICMNAGAYGGEIKDIVKDITVLENGVIKKLTKDEAEFSYRNSKIMREKMVVLEVVLELEKGNKEEIQEKMKLLMAQRNEKQPVNLPSAGSTFKRPEGYFAAKLIDDCGLRGFSVGDAEVSKKHCGFVVNNKNASACDVLKLMEIVSKKVKDEFGVLLEPEVRIIGEWQKKMGVRIWGA